jgi:hypothetical protein
MGEHGRIATTGFSRMSDRQLGLWDIKNPSEPIDGFQMLDAISGVCMPFWDDGNKMLYLAGKGYVSRRLHPYQLLTDHSVMAISAILNMKMTSSNISLNTNRSSRNAALPFFPSEA